MKRSKESSLFNRRRVDGRKRFRSDWMLIYWKMITKTLLPLRVVSSRLDVIDISFIRSGFPIESDFLCAKFALALCFVIGGFESTTASSTKRICRITAEEWQWAQSDANNDDDTRKFASKLVTLAGNSNSCAGCNQSTCFAGTEPHFVSSGICWITTHDALGPLLIHNARR